MGSWTFFAHKRPNGEYYHFNTSLELMYLYGRGDIYEVVVEASANGQYYGWISKDTTKPSLIWSNEVLFNMCFANGYKVSEAMGNGKHIRLDVKEKP